MIVYSEEDLRVLIQMVGDPYMTNGLEYAFYKTGGTLQYAQCFCDSYVLEFLAAKFEDVPKYIGAKFSTLIKWRLTIGK